VHPSWPGFGACAGFAGRRSNARKTPTGGEALPAQLPKNYRAARAVTCSICTADGNHRLVCGATRDAIGAASLRRPIATRQLHSGQKSPNRAHRTPGEIFSGGEGVARGYLAVQNSRQSVPPQSVGKADNSRIIEPAISGVFGPDGTMNSWPLDHQVKNFEDTGELGEIESALAGHPAVQEAVVLAREDQSGENRSCYVVPQTEIETEELRRFWKDGCSAMVPSRFLFPKNCRSHQMARLNRRALPAPEEKPTSQNRVPLRASNGDGKNDCGVWRDLLRVEKVGLHDNFFDLAAIRCSLVRSRRSLSGKLKMICRRQTIPVPDRPFARRVSERKPAHCRGELMPVASASKPPSPTIETGDEVLHEHPPQKTNLASPSSAWLGVSPSKNVDEFWG